MKLTLIENFRAVFYAPYYAAAALRAYESEGLSIEMRLSQQSGSRFVVSQEGEVSWGGPLRLMHTLQQDPGAGVAAFCEVVGRDPFVLVGREPRPSFRLEDLQGARLATVSEVPTPWICLRHDLRLRDIDENRIARVAGLSMAESADALRAGRVDAIQVFEPYASELEGEGAGSVWYAAASRGPTSYTTFNTTRGFLEREPAVALGMCRAMHRTLKWIASHRGAEVAAAIAEYFPALSSRVLALAIDRYRAAGIWNRSPVPDRAGFEWLRDAALRAGMLRTPFRYEDCVDRRFAEQAFAEDPPAL